MDSGVLIRRLPAQRTRSRSVLPYRKCSEPRPLRFDPGEAAMKWTGTEVRRSSTPRRIACRSTSRSASAVGSVGYFAASTQPVPAHAVQKQPSHIHPVGEASTYGPSGVWQLKQNPSPSHSEHEIRSGKERAVLIRQSLAHAPEAAAALAPASSEWRASAGQPALASRPLAASSSGSRAEPRSSALS